MSITVSPTQWPPAAPGRAGPGRAGQGRAGPGRAAWQHGTPVLSHVGGHPPPSISRSLINISAASMHLPPTSAASLSLSLSLSVCLCARACVCVHLWKNPMIIDDHHWGRFAPRTPRSHSPTQEKEPRPGVSTCWNCIASQTVWPWPTRIAKSNASRSMDISNQSSEPKCPNSLAIKPCSMSAQSVIAHSYSYTRFCWRHWEVCPKNFKILWMAQAILEKSLA